MVTGGPGSGKTAILGLIATLSHPERSGTVPKSHLGLAPHMIPAKGSLDVALYAQGLTDSDVLRGLAAAMKVRAETSDALLAALETRPGTRAFTWGDRARSWLPWTCDRRRAGSAPTTAGTATTAAANLAAAVAARAHALSHQTEQARHALAEADRLMNRLDSGQQADTWLTYSEQKHHVHLSHALTALGDTQRAHESQTRALELSAPTSSMTRTLLKLDAAAHHDGDIEQACQRATAALTPSRPATARAWSAPAPPTFTGRSPPSTTTSPLCASSAPS